MLDQMLLSVETLYNSPVCSISALISASKRSKIRPLCSNTVKREIVSSSTSVLGHMALIDVENDKSFVINFTPNVSDTIHLNRARENKPLEPPRIFCSQPSLSSY